MIRDVFASLISITKGLHRDKRTERDFKDLNHKANSNINFSEAPLFKIEFSERALGDKRKYYKRLIDNEASSKFNTIINSFPDNAIQEEHIFNYQQLFQQHRQHLIDVKKYIDNHGCDRDYLKDVNAYIIQYLKSNMIWLYMELQERFSKYGNEDILTIEEVYSYYFEEDLSHYDVRTNTDTHKEQVPKKVTKSKTSVKKKPTKKVSFGYKHRDKEKLKTALKSLVLKIDLIDENRTSVDDLFNLMAASNFQDISNKIYLSCETTQFRYIIDAFKPHFTNFTPTAIDNTELFFTKNNVLLKKSNLYKNKVFEPKAKADIDKIINQLQ